MALHGSYDISLANPPENALWQEYCEIHDTPSMRAQLATLMADAAMDVCRDISSRAPILDEVISGWLAQQDDELVLGWLADYGLIPTFEKWCTE